MEEMNMYYCYLCTQIPIRNLGIEVGDHCYRLSKTYIPYHRFHGESSEEYKMSAIFDAEDLGFKFELISKAK